MQRYFLTDPYEAKSEYEVTGESYHHMIRVIRMSKGDHVYLAFANQITIVAEITAVLTDKVLLKEIEKEHQEKELPVHITIASGYPKGDKLEWIIQKGTELGAHDFIGFPAQSSVVKWDDKKRVKKQQRCDKIAQEAAEQSHRQVTPQVTLLATAQEFYQRLAEYDEIVVAYEEAAKAGEKSQLAKVLSQTVPGAKILAIFGPEGGLTPKEIDLLIAQKAVLCGLGPRILRCETAPLYFLSAVSYQLELQ